MIHDAANAAVALLHDAVAEVRDMMKMRSGGGVVMMMMKMAIERVKRRGRLLDARRRRVGDSLPFVEGESDDCKQAG